MKKGIVIIDRGSREEEAKQELKVICDKVKKKGNYSYTDYCFLEVVPPFIEEGIKTALKENLQSLTIVPYFLYPGKKVKLAVNKVIKFQPITNSKFVITKPMSMHKTMIDLVDNRITTSLKENNCFYQKRDVDVLIIGHGSKDLNAQLSIKYVVDGLKANYRNVSHCFLEIEEPNIHQGIKESEKNNPKALVIVFYFLHEGAHVKRDIFEDLNPALEKSNLKEVFITNHIGADEKMVDLILERALEVENAN